jgi:hypothetical protein
MKKLIIRNLRTCFEHNVTFAELAEFERKVFDSNDIIKKIEIGKNFIEFKKATINSDNLMVLYYEYAYLPF